MRAPRLRRKEAIQFTRGKSFYQVVENYRGGQGWVGLKDGRVVVAGDDRVAIAGALISPQSYKFAPS